MSAEVFINGVHESVLLSIGGAVSFALALEVLTSSKMFQFLGFWFYITFLLSHTFHALPQSSILRFGFLSFTMFGHPKTASVFLSFNGIVLKIVFLVALSAAAAHRGVNRESRKL